MPVAALSLVIPGSRVPGTCFRRSRRSPSIPVGIRSGHGTRASLNGTGAGAGPAPVPAVQGRAVPAALRPGPSRTHDRDRSRRAGGRLPRGCV